MRIVSSSATHVGQVRNINQDRVLATATLAVVADGMGGHVGGEKAAALAIAEFSGVRGSISAQRLVDVAQAANRRVFDAAQVPELRGMGTTLVAAAFDPELGVVSIANIGDSRAYLLRGDHFEQVTLDHSLVEELLRQGRLSDDEARSHPQRNMVTRALGIGPDVDVDVFDILVEPEDRILLCSDGLTNEVDDDGVADILRSYPDPDEAADVLVDTALHNGGRDNVTVVVMRVVDDDGPDTTVRVDADEAADAAVLDLARDDAEPLPDLSADPLADTRRPAKRRRLPFRGLMFAGSVVSVLVLAGSFTTWYGRSAWYVDEVDGQVVIMHGRPGGVLWIQPDTAEETGIAFDDLTGASQTRVTDRVVLGSLSDAQELVANLESSESPGG